MFLHLSHVNVRMFSRSGFNELGVMNYTLLRHYIIILQGTLICLPSLFPPV